MYFFSQIYLKYDPCLKQPVGGIDVYYDFKIPINYNLCEKISKFTKIEVQLILYLSE